MGARACARRVGVTARALPPSGESVLDPSGDVARRDGDADRSDRPLDGERGERSGRDLAEWGLRPGEASCLFVSSLALEHPADAPAGLSGPPG